MTIVQLAGLVAIAADGWATVAGVVAHTAASWLVDSSAAADNAPWLTRRTPVAIG